MPKGGGAIRGIGEKFAANPVTGTGSMSVPIATSPGRSGFGPQLSLAYDSGAGNGLFGFGWSLALPSITRKTDQGLPQYLDREESDVFTLSGAEDLVPELKQDSAGNWLMEDGTFVVLDEQRIAGGATYRVRRYRPRIEGLFARIERWTNIADPSDMHWRSISQDNILTLYGTDAGSRIADPAAPQRIFSWLISQTRDDKGNAVVYTYAAEDGAGIDLARTHERNRGGQNDPRRTTNRYIKRIRYGNRVPLLDSAGRRPRVLPSTQLDTAVWMFELVFDYDQGHVFNETTSDGQTFVEARTGATTNWSFRDDPFSSYRAGFEVRTTRLCRRVLMFHHFADEPGVGNDCLVRSTDFTYTHEQDPANARNPVYTFLRAVSQSGYRRHDQGYLKRSLPPVEYEYTQPMVQETLHEVDAESLENLPIGVDGAAYQWTDLHGEGIPGILTEQAGAWFYKRNISPISERPVEFAPSERVAAKPNLALAGGQAQFMDLAGDGQPDLVVLDGPLPGLYEHDDAEGWQLFRPFAARLNRDTHDPNLRFVDLDGDGHADVLITEHNAMVWHASLAEDGFGPARRIAQALDEEMGPRLVFADGTQSVYLADLSGDGLADLVRIRNGQICYWPNLGYGRFGAKVTMDHAPFFDRPDRFDQQRIRLADIDGTGTTDLIYLHPDSVRLFFNQSGNSWSEPQHVRVFPRVDELVAIAATDLLGNGTACLVWSSPLPGDTRQRMRYVDLMGGQKPHLLVKTVNNLGAETRMVYVPSTKFYLQDKADGKPWITRLPFPVHVVERVETYDHVSGNRFVTRYAYHHGSFDGDEREFRGFGMVEQFDSEEFAALAAAGTLPAVTNLDAASHVPPVLTKTWFHTGAYRGRRHISDFFAGLDAAAAGEYYREPGLDDAAARQQLLEDTLLPPGLTGEEEPEACRALKGAMLRQEVYALDGTDKQTLPYAVTEQNFTIRLLQPRAGNRHAVFFTHAREALSHHYERNPADPRIGHTLTLSVDEFGNVLRSAAIGYGRREPDATLPEADRSRQSQIFVTFSDNSFTNPIAQDDYYRAPLPSEARTYELSDLRLPSAATRFGFDEVLEAIDMAAEVPYQQQAGPGQKRLIEHLRTRYRPDDLGASAGDASALLPVGVLESLALAGESYRLAFMPGLVEYLFGGRVTPTMLASEGGYVDPAADGTWWLPAGRVFLSPVAGDTPAQEFANARAHFFIPRCFRDPFGNEAVITLDAYDLLDAETRDPLDNTVGAANDYRTLQPRLVTDPNGNRTEVAFDALGMLVGTAIMGKPGEGVGDTLAGFVADLPEADVLAHLIDPLAGPHAILQGATTRLIYDLFAYQRTRLDAQPAPAVVYTLARETHASELVAGAVSNIQHSFGYSDGFGREIQKKIQAEPGPLTTGGPQFNPRWTGSGWTVFNNKGKPVRQFEPFFGDTHRFEFDMRRGVSPIMCYDPLGRVVATLHPNHTWQKVVFDPWRQASWDVNDTAPDDPAGDVDVGDFFARLPADDYLPTWHAQRIGGALGAHELAAATATAVHAATPSVAHMDSLGRTFLTVAHNKLERSDAPAEESFLRTRVVLDIEGNQREVVDALERIVMRYDYDMLGNKVHSAGMEAGERWMQNDVAGKPIRAWDSRGHAFRTEYDALRRPLHSFVSGSDGAQSDPRVLGREVMFAKIEYGEGQHDDSALNLRTRVFQAHDGAGIVTSAGYDFKGNLLRGSRRLAVDYKDVLDWSGVVALEEGSYTSSTTYDALNRPLTATSPDGSVLRPAFNEANLLERIDANMGGEQRDGEAAWTPFVTNIDYNAKGQRERIDYANGAGTLYTYDPLTFRLARLFTRRNAAAFPDDCPAGPRAGWPGCAVQNLSYTYDPAGNITHMEDDAQQTIYFRNRRVEPSNDYRYDATYQLIEATGREHLGQTGGVPTAPDALGSFRTGLLHPGDGTAMGTYLERYDYDVAGNILRMVHGAAGGSWSRGYTYAEPSLIEPAKQSNRLSATQIGAGPLERYTNDAHGNMTSMPHLPLMQWTFLDQLHASSKQVAGDGTPETTFYVYDAAGQRVRKVTERQAAAGDTPARKNERIYLGGFELYREYGGDGNTVALERETLHVMDDKQRVAMVETRTQGDDGSAERLIRFQIGNHLGSAALELDEAARIISYEEYFPYGSTSYQAVDASIKAAAKRYRYTGMERDEGTGLAYHGARYYACWLGRWTAADPLGIKDGLNIFVYVRNAPTNGIDPLGTEALPLMVGQTLKAIRDEAYRDVPEEERATALLDMPVAENASRLAWATFKVLVADTASSIAGVSNAPTSPETKLESNHAAGFNSVLLFAPTAKWLGIRGALATTEGTAISRSIVEATGNSRSTGGPFEFIDDLVTSATRSEPNAGSIVRPYSPEVIVKLPQNPKLAVTKTADVLAKTRSAPIVSLEQLGDYPEVEHLVFQQHSNPDRIGGMTAYDLDRAIRNANVSPDILELAGCRTGAPGGRLAPDLASLQQLPVIAYPNKIASFRGELIQIIELEDAKLLEPPQKVLIRP